MWNSDCYGIDFFQNVTYCKIYYSFIIHPITEVRMRITNLEGYNILLIIMLNNTIELLKVLRTKKKERSKEQKTMRNKIITERKKLRYTLLAANTSVLFTYSWIKFWKKQWFVLHSPIFSQMLLLTISVNSTNKSYTFYHF